MLRTRALAILIASALLCTGASAQALTPISQDRSVHGTQHHVIYNNSGSLVSDFSDSESFSAPDFGGFIAHTDGFHWPYFSSDTATQVSGIQAEKIHAEGGVFAIPDTRLLEIHEISGESSFSTTFELLQSRSYTLTGQVDLNLLDCDAYVTGRIRLSSAADGVIAEVDDTFSGCGAIGCEETLPLSASGVLSPGTYTLEAYGNAWGNGRMYPSDFCPTSIAIGSYQADLRLRQVGEVPALPAPLAPLLGLVLAGSARRRARR